MVSYSGKFSLALGEVESTTFTLCRMHAAFISKIFGLTVLITLNMELVKLFPEFVSS